MTAHEEFLQRIEAFLEANSMGAATFGKKALKDPNFVFDLRGGRSVGLNVVQRVNDFMAEYKSSKAA